MVRRKGLRDADGSVLHITDQHLNTRREIVDELRHIVEVASKRSAKTVVDQQGNLRVGRKNLRHGLDLRRMTFDLEGNVRNREGLRILRVRLDESLGGHTALLRAENRSGSEGEEGDRQNDILHGI